MEQELNSLRYKSRFGKVCVFFMAMDDFSSFFFDFRGKACPIKGLGQKRIVLTLWRWIQLWSQIYSVIVIVSFQHLEDVILFKNQELSEFTADLKVRDEKISMLENIWFRCRENIPKQVRDSLTSWHLEIC